MQHPQGTSQPFFHIVNILLSPHHISSACFIQTIITRKSLGLNILTEGTSQSGENAFHYFIPHTKMTGLSYHL